MNIMVSGVEAPILPLGCSNNPVGGVSEHWLATSRHLGK